MKGSSAIRFGVLVGLLFGCAVAFAQETKETQAPPPPPPAQPAKTAAPAATAASAKDNPKTTVFPFMGRVTSSHVNVRALPGTQSAIVTQINENTDLLVLSENNNWYEIRYPDTLSFWVFSKYVNGTQVKGEKVHVRTGPGVNYPSVVQLTSGDTVKVKNTVGNWVEIFPPEKLTGWLSTEYISYFSPADQYEQKTAEEKEARNLLAAADTLKQTEYGKPVDQINFEPVINQYKAVLAKYPFSKEAKSALQSISDLEIKKLYSLKNSQQTRNDETQVEREKILVQIQDIRDDFYKQRTPADSQAHETAVQLLSLLEKTYPDAPETAIAREICNDISRTYVKQKNEQVAQEAENSVTYRGKLRKRKSTQDPGTHVLVSGIFDTKLCFLKSDTIDLDVYLNSNVQVKGNYNLVKGFKPPLVTVREIEAVGARSDSES